MLPLTPRAQASPPPPRSPSHVPSPAHTPAHGPWWRRQFARTKHANMAFPMGAGKCFTEYTLSFYRKGSVLNRSLDSHEATLRAAAQVGRAQSLHTHHAHTHTLVSITIVHTCLCPSHAPSVVHALAWPKTTSPYAWDSRSALPADSVAAGPPAGWPRAKIGAANQQTVTESQW